MYFLSCIGFGGKEEEKVWIMRKDRLFFAEHQTKNEQVDQSNPNKDKSSTITAESISKAISSVQPMDTTSSESSMQGK